MAVRWIVLAGQGAAQLPSGVIPNWDVGTVAGLSDFVRKWKDKICSPNKDRNLRVPAS